ncbi:MAG: hypothetical protein IMZ59_03300 [Actinobacteria bacterium]|nr:hypothetical protein [Actinomycetota bacterium]
MRYTGIIILLVLCLTLLLLTGCIVNAVIAKIAIENIENQEDINQNSNNFQSSSTDSVQAPTEQPGTENPQKWPGLGMFIHEDYEAGSIERDDNSVDILLANGFTELRDYLVGYEDPWDLARAKAAVLRAIAKGAKVIWGVSSNTHKDYAITATTWPLYRQGILDAAQWAQDNGVFEFGIGNEEESHVDGTTITVAQIITNLKAVATDVQAIFTNGNISYSCSDYAIPNWIASGRGDIDILASNIYHDGYGDWKTNITNLVIAFGADHTYLTEFGLSWNDIDDYSTDEAVQAAGITEMIDYIKASGMTRAIYFLWYLPGLNFGVLKDDSTYRLLWSQALLNSESVKSITVPTKTATILLPKPKK